MPESFWTSPLVYQGGSDDFTPPCGDIRVPQDDFGIDFEAEIAIVTDDVPMLCSEQDAEKHIKLIMLVNDVSLRNLIPGELAKGFGFYQSKPSTSFSPVAVTPDELGKAWVDACVHLPLAVDLNRKPFGRAHAGNGMTFSFARLIEHATKTRRLGAGTIVGSGTVSNRGADGGPGKAIAEGGLGYSCIAEVRSVEAITQGSPLTPFMHDGDHVRIEMRRQDGSSIFGAIDQMVVCRRPVN
jgi:fumarylacetoacetate (FAA) hydrolase